MGREQVSAGGTVTPETTGGGAALHRFEEEETEKEGGSWEGQQFYGTGKSL